MTTEQFSTYLRALVREAAVSSDSPDPAVVAEVVLGRLTVKQYKAALGVCLGDWVRLHMKGYSSAALNAPRLGGLTKADRCRSWYESRLSTPEFVGKEWKFLRDCTADDLHAVAAVRYKMAVEIHAVGDTFTKVALFMEEHGRATVADVREAELKQLMEDS